MDRKARQARRDQSFNRKTGRKPGMVPFIKDQKRFEYALWFFLTNTLGYPTLKAARIAAAFLDDRSPVTTLTDRTGISALYQGGRGSAAALNDRAKYLIKHADEIISRADEQGKNWLAQSAGALHAVFTFVAAGNVGGVNLAIEMLDSLGWKKTRTRIIRVATAPKN